MSLDLNEMSEEMLEAVALQTVERAQGRKYSYTGSDSTAPSGCGTFERLDDMNCCAPTSNVLFSFSDGTSRRVLSAKGLLEFFSACKECSRQ